MIYIPVILFFLNLIFFPPQTLAQQPPPVITAQLVKTIETSQFSPSAPDPAGIDYIASKNKFIISDSEVDEMPIFAGSNVYEYPQTAAVNGIYSTLSFSKEPTGVSYDPVANLYFFSDDDRDLITKVNPGPDGQLGSSDDSVSSFNTLSFGNTDAEGVFARNGRIFIPGGVDKKVFITDYSGNLINSFDVGRLGINDFEGVTVHPASGNLFILSRNPKTMLETALSGNLIRKYDITSLSSKAPADIVFAPSSDTADDPTNLNIYIVDRMVDNNADPNENDGRIYEISINSNNPTSPPAITVTLSVSPTPAFHCPTLTPPICNGGRIIQGTPTPGACPYNICVTFTPPPPPTGGGKPGDANFDNKVDGVDYVLWLNNYNKNATGAASGDFDGNGAVDGLDYFVWLSNYNK